MKKSSKPKTQRRLGIKWRIVAITTLPMLFACFMISFFAVWILVDGLNVQILTGLKESATGVLFALDNNSTESFRMEGEDLYKGDYNVTQNMGGIDYYAQSNDIQVTLFYGDVRRATTIKDSDGSRILGTAASSEVSEAVLRRGEEYSTSKGEVNGERYFCYYMPVTDTEGQIIGMIFAGKSFMSMARYINARVTVIILLAVLNYISCFVVATYVSKKRFLTPIHMLNDAAGELARGNINLELKHTSNDEFGDLTNSFQTLVSNIENQAHAAENMAQGDLTVVYEPVDSGDVMGHAIEKMLHDNNQNLHSINDASDKMVTGVREISEASNLLAQGSTEQASAIEQITSSIEGIASSAEVNAADASHANELVLVTREKAVHSNEQMRDMMTAMHAISESAENISGVMKVINDIASQTNIISLNASVEAARAGEHGKGFAVVAEEIRNLAAKSADAASSSAVLIEDSIRKAATGAKLAQETEAALEEILESVENMAAIVNNIAKASAAQSVSVHEVNTGITQIASVVQRNSATSQECAAASDELSGLADQLKEAVDKYRLR